MEDVFVQNFDVAGARWDSGETPTMLFRLAFVDVSTMLPISTMALATPGNVLLRRRNEDGEFDVHVLVGGIPLDYMWQPISRYSRFP